MRKDPQYRLLYAVPSMYILSIDLVATHRRSCVFSDVAPQGGGLPPATGWTVAAGGKAPAPKLTAGPA